MLSKGEAQGEEALGDMADQPDRSIQIQERAVGSAIVSGYGNTIYVIHKATQQRQDSPLISLLGLALIHAEKILKLVLLAAFIEQFEYK